MVLKLIFFTILIAEFRNGFCSIPKCAFEACERITSPENFVTSCCPQTNLFVNVNKGCITKDGSSILTTCDQAKCITGEYGILTDDEVDFDKVEQTIQRLNEMDSSLKYVNSLVIENCVKKNYTSFLVAEDPECLPWRFLKCSFYSYRVGCCTTNTAGDCAAIADDVNKCKPYQDQYVQELNDKFLENL